MRIIFLDFDGVVCVSPGLGVPQRRRPAHYGSGTVPCLDGDAVGWLTKLVEWSGGAEIVISSTWRMHTRLEELEDSLRLAGFQNRGRKLLGVTPKLIRPSPTPGSSLSLGVERGYEVKAWLDAEIPEGYTEWDGATDWRAQRALVKEPIEGYVVLDDDGDRGPIPDHRWVRIKDGWVTGGLRREHAFSALDLIRVPTDVDAVVAKDRAENPDTDETS